MALDRVNGTLKEIVGKDCGMAIRLGVMVGLLFSVAAMAEFTFEDRDGSLTLLENGKPVYSYRYEMVAPPQGVPAHFSRSCYIHPLYDLNGNVITQDFPIDHFHHRGVFWAWPECKAGERPMDVWALGNVRQRHEEWLARETGTDRAVMAVRNRWAFDADPEKAVVREEVRITAFPSGETGRPLDFDIRLTNVSGDSVTFLGAKNKGYGGFCFRPDAKNKPFVFTTAKGVCPEDALQFDTPWADVSWAKEGGAGVAIFEHPSNPGYPFPGWIFRHYAFLGASWPHEQEHVLKPGESFQLRYRLYIHAGDAEKGEVERSFRDYTATVER